MKVKCLINNLCEISHEETRARLAEFIHMPDGDSNLEIGETYEVQALEYRDSNVWLYIHTVESNEYPFPYPIEFFQTEDSSLPTNWQASLIGDSDNPFLKRLTFPEWAHNDLFFEMLIDGEPGYVATYATLRQS